MKPKKRKNNKFSYAKLLSEEFFMDFLVKQPDFKKNFFV